jgi:hypothetical protein
MLGQDAPALSVSLKCPNGSSDCGMIVGVAALALLRRRSEYIPAE